MRPSILLAAAVAALSVRGDGGLPVTDIYATPVVLDTRATTYDMPGKASFRRVPPFTFGTNDAGTVTVTAPDGASRTFTAATWPGDLAHDGGWALDAKGEWTFSLAGALPSDGSATFNKIAGTMDDPELFGGVVIDTRQDSTNRVVAHVWEIPPIAYTADGWAYESADAVTLSFTSPRGASDVHDDLNGSGGFSFTPLCGGLWRVLMSSGGADDEATILLGLPGTMLSYQ